MQQSGIRITVSHIMRFVTYAALLLCGAALSVVLLMSHASAQQDQIVSFESWCKWKRGTQSWGNFSQSKDQVHDGSFAGKLAYDFPENEPENFVVFQCPTPIAGNPSQLSAWVYGDGSGHILNVWIQDSTGQKWQFSFGQVKHNGWQQMFASINPSLPWPNDPLDGSDATTVVYPIEFDALVLDNPGSAASKGAIFVDSVASSSAENASNTPEQKPTDTPTSTPTGRDSASPKEPEVEFYAEPSTVSRDQCATLYWTVSNVSEYYVNGEGKAGDVGQQLVCPGGTTEYVLLIVTLTGKRQEYRAHVEVVESASEPGHPIQMKYERLGGNSGFLGEPTSDVLSTSVGGSYQLFQQGSIYWHPDLGAFEVHGEILDRWRELGFEHSYLGYPVSDVLPSADGVDRVSLFERGVIYWSPSTGAKDSAVDPSSFELITDSLGAVVAVQPPQTFLAGVSVGQVTVLATPLPTATPRPTPSTAPKPQKPTHNPNSSASSSGPLGNRSGVDRMEVVQCELDRAQDCSTLARNAEPGEFSFGDSLCLVWQESGEPSGEVKIEVYSRLATFMPEFLLLTELSGRMMDTALTQLDGRVPVQTMRLPFSGQNSCSRVHISAFDSGYYAIVLTASDKRELRIWSVVRPPWMQ